MSLFEVGQILKELIEEEKTREEVASWALARQSAEENDELEYEPPSEKAKILTIIIYLMGVDLRDLDGSYLHSTDNFIDFKNNLEV